MRLIDADKIPYVDLSYGKTACFVAFAEKINQMPTIEPERKKGKWTHDKPNGFTCSKCNKYLDIGGGNMKMNFCPNCGIKMER